MSARCKHERRDHGKELHIGGDGDGDGDGGERSAQLRFLVQFLRLCGAVY